MKISVSIPEDDVTFVDNYAQRNATSRSAAVHAAIETLRRLDVSAEYEQAYTDAETSGETATWDGAAGDGLE